MKMEGVAGVCVFAFALSSLVTSLSFDLLSSCAFHSFFLALKSVSAKARKRFSIFGDHFRWLGPAGSAAGCESSVLRRSQVPWVGEVAKKLQLLLQGHHHHLPMCIERALLVSLHPMLLP
jgi:hypothetical protein